MIPILDLVQQYRSLKTEIDTAIERVLESGVFIMGPNVDAFEKEMAAYLDVAHAIALNSGTDALHLALRGLGIGPGDEVITSPFTFVATTEAIGIVGATPVFVDVEQDDLNINSDLIERAITTRTKAILPIHLFGSPANMQDIQLIAKRHGLAVVEDCAQAIGAYVNDRKVGTIGDVGCFSFFPSKNLGAYGDGGLLTTNNANLAARIRALRVHGGQRKYYHDELGINSRLDEIQAAILRVKFPHLDSWMHARRQIAARYTEALHSVPGVTTPVERRDRLHVYHQYTIRIQDRDDVRTRLAEAGIQTMVYYPVPLHLQKVHGELRLNEIFPISERAAGEVLSLPMYPELTPQMQTRVIDAIKSTVGVSVSA